MFETRFGKQCEPSPLLDKITFISSAGKASRCELCSYFGSQKACGGVYRRHLYRRFAGGTAPYRHPVHDDVVDDSYERRGFFSINALWKNKLPYWWATPFLPGYVAEPSEQTILALEIVSDAGKAMSEENCCRSKRPAGWISRKRSIRDHPAENGFPLLLLPAVPGCFRHHR